MSYKRIASLLMALTLVAIVATSSAAAQQREAEVALQQALHVEQVEGDLERAIRLYREVVEDYSAVREIAAKAQLHVGLCYEKLGFAEARQAYRDVIDNFPEQRDEVALAEERLADLTQQLAELRRQPTFTKIEIASKPQNGWVTPLHGNVDPTIAGEPVRIAEVPEVWDLGSLLSWSADGEWIAVNSSADDWAAAYIISATGGEPRAIDMPDRGTGVVWTHRLGLSPDGQQVAFSAVEVGSFRPRHPYHRYVYVVSSAGRDPRPLSSGWASMPAFSADGVHVAYVGYREAHDLQNSDLWVVPAAGGAPAKLANISGRLRGPVWSPDGRFIAAHHEPGRDSDSREIWVYPLSADRSSAGEPMKIGLPRSSWNILAGWTPDNKLGVFIASQGHTAVYTVPASGGKAVQTTPLGYAWYPRWSVDGERIYFRSFHESPERVSIGFTPATGGDVVEVSVRSDRSLVSVVPGAGFNVSPDGEKIVFSGYQAPWNPQEGSDVWVIPLDGERPARLTSDASREGYPCWSPDGAWIAFMDRLGLSEGEDIGAIFLVPAEGGEVRQLTVESDSVGGGAIAFSPDGERIAFFSGGTIKTIPVQGGQSVVLFSAPETDWHSQLVWSPDGSNIAYSAAGKIWVTSADQGEPVALRTGLPEGTEHGDFSWSPDGEKIAFVASSGGEAEFWLISDFLPKER